MRFQRALLSFLALAPFVAGVGCRDSQGPTGLSPDELDAEQDSIAVTGMISTPAGNRVEGVHIQLWGVTDTALVATFDELAEAFSDAAGEFSVSHESCTDHSRYFVELEIACFPIGVREVGCGVRHFEFIWTPPGASASLPTTDLLRVSPSPVCSQVSPLGLFSRVSLLGLFS